MGVIPLPLLSFSTNSKPHQPNYNTISALVYLVAPVVYRIVY